MVEGNELPQLMKKIENVQIRLKRSEKKIKLVVITLQTPIKNAPNEKVRNLTMEDGKMIRRRKKKGKSALLKQTCEYIE